MSAPAYTRLENDERRRRLLELGTRLFTEHAYDEISMARIAREAGISKALIYEHFPSKRDLHVSLLERHVAETDSVWAAQIMNDLRTYLPKFWVVKPKAASIDSLIAGAVEPK